MSLLGLKHEFARTKLSISQRTLTVPLPPPLHQIATPHPAPIPSLSRPQHSKSCPQKFLRHVNPDSQPLTPYSGELLFMD